MAIHSGIFNVLTPNRVELGEIAKTAKSLFPSASLEDDLKNQEEPKIKMTWNLRQSQKLRWPERGRQPQKWGWPQKLIWPQEWRWPKNQKKPPKIKQSQNEYDSRLVFLLVAFLVYITWHNWQSQERALKIKITFWMKTLQVLN